jgi:hypothetical protein
VKNTPQNGIEKRNLNKRLVTQTLLFLKVVDFRSRRLLSAGRAVSLLGLRYIFNEACAPASA